MASARIAVNTGKVLGARLVAWANLVAHARMQAGELARVLDKYIDDTAALAADLGVAAADVPLVRNLITGSANELAGLASTAVGLGEVTQTRQLVDALSTGG